MDDAPKRWFRRGRVTTGDPRHDLLVAAAELVRVRDELDRVSAALAQSERRRLDLQGAGETTIPRTDHAALTEAYQAIADLQAQLEDAKTSASHDLEARFATVLATKVGQLSSMSEALDEAAESAHGEFTAADEQLALALADTAAVAIDTARLFEETERRRRWLAASIDVTHRLFAGTTRQPLDLVLEHAAQGAAADVASLLLLVGEEQVRVHACVGVHAEDMAGRILGLDHTLAGQAIRSQRPVRLDGLSTPTRGTASDTADTEDLPADVGSAICAPLLAGDRVLGALCIGRLHGQAAFTDSDMRQLAAFANYAGVALELDRARADREALRLTQDHDRIAADLHDHVVQELYAAAMRLQRLAQQRPDLEGPILAIAEALDATIDRIRDTIHQLDPPRTDSLKQRLLTLLDDHAPGLGFHPRIEFDGPLDLAIPPALADDIVAVIREALSNTARHAHADTASVLLAVTGEQVTIDITDDGHGIGSSTRSSGLTNLRHRADTHHGTFDITTPPSGGTHLHWTAHITDPTEP